MRSLLVSLLVLAAACEGPAGPQGAQGSNGSDGSAGATGDAGPPGGSGSQGEPGIGPWLTKPGVAIAVTELTVGATGASVAFTLTDGSGHALDTTGRLTDGTVGVSFVLAQLAQNADGSPAQYTAYTTAVQTSPNGSAAVQATAESSGTLAVVDVTQGTYTYAFAAPLTGLDPTLTQTVGALAVRAGSSGEAIASTTFSARPDGGAVTAREVVQTGACNACHKALGAHGGRWTATTQCVLCHQPQTTDPDTGNTVDFKIMLHKLHRGSSLPSVVAGTPYEIIGYAQSVADFSGVQFPQNIARCTACHAGAQGARWQTAPTHATCTSCHDLTSFTQPVPAGQTLHGGGVQTSDATCAVCHPASGGLAGIADVHLTGTLSPSAPTVGLTILAITNTAPGQIPVLTFQATVNGAPRDLLAAPLTRIAANIAGPTTDFSTEFGARIQGSGATGTLAVVDAATGTYSYTFPASAAIPTTATGTFEVGMEGFLQPTPTDPRYAAVNPVLAFAVTDATPQPRRSIVSRENCNGCHYDLSAHGGARKNPDYCVFCHNPANNDAGGAPRFEGTSNVLGETIDFRRFIHKIHAGTTLTQGFLFGEGVSPTSPGGTPIDFGAVQYPRPLTDCNACHKAVNWTLPMANSPAYAASTSALLSCSEPPGADANTYCDDPFWTSVPVSIAPQTSVCTSCHDGPQTAVHAQLNTTAGGAEACAACHGLGTQYDVTLYHGLP